MNRKCVILTDSELETVTVHAQKACIGGLSNIRTIDRKATLFDDQLTAQCGEAALSKLITGNIDLYVNTRLEREKNPHKGDNGSDLLGFEIDVKTSRMRYGENRLYNLWVRPREYHKETIYYLALMNPSDNKKVYFSGWVQGEYLNYSEDKYAAREDVLNNMEAGTQ